MDNSCDINPFKAKAILSTQQTNCVVDFIEESNALAVSLRDIPVDQRGPLFGIPISVKECHFVKVTSTSKSNLFLIIIEDFRAMMQQPG